MITPEGSQPGGEQPKRSKAVLLGVAAVVVVGGLIALGSLTSPGQPAATTATLALATTEPTPPPETSVDAETFSMSQITRGEPFRWEQTLAIAGGYPLALTEHDGELYLFVTEELPYVNGGTGGLRAWRSPQGETWESLGQVIEGQHKITAVSSTGQGLVALEQNAAGQGFMVWWSDIGMNWRPQNIHPESLNTFETIYPSAVGGTADLLIVSARVHLDVIELLRGRFDNETLNRISSFGSGIDLNDGTLAVTAYGPGGLPLIVQTAADLGLTDEEQASAIEAYEGGVGEHVWVNRGGTWEEGTLPEERGTILRMIDTPFGQIMGFGLGNSGPDAWLTSDGTTWTDTAPGGRYGGEVWGDRVIGPSITNDLSLFTLDVDGNLEDVGPGDLFPRGMGWSMGPMAAGPGGVAIEIAASPRADPAAEEDRTGSVTRGGVTLTIDHLSNEYTLDGDVGHHTWRVQDDLPPGMEVDVEDWRVSFYQPGTEELLASFDLDDIDRAYQSWQARQASPPGERAFAFTPDGSEWTIQDLTPSFGDSEVILLEVTASHVNAVVADLKNLLTQNRSALLRVLSAPIP